MLEHSSLQKPASRVALTPRPKPLSHVAPQAASRLRHTTASGGQTLDAKTQREMGSRFGHNFSQVRIHTDARAVESAQALGANAYAVGSDIVFGVGGYVPGSREGDRLLAHELTHVVQQARHGLGREERLSRQGDASEQEAEALAGQVLAGQSVRVSALPQAAVSREGDGSGTTDGQNMLINTAMMVAGLLPGPAGLAGKGLSLGLGALGIEEGSRQMPKPGDTDADIKRGEGYAGALATTIGTGASLFGGFDAVAAVGLGAEAGLGAGSVFGGAGAGAAALGPAGLVLGSGLLGMGAGHLLAEHTEVGADTVGAVGGIDNMLTGKGERSAMLRLDEYRQDQWDKGGLGGVGLSALAGVGEGVVGLGGAVGGLAEGAYHGLGAIGSGIAGLFD